MNAPSHPDCSGYFRRNPDSPGKAQNPGGILLFFGILTISTWAVSASEKQQSFRVDMLDSAVLKTSTYQDYHISRALKRRKAALLIFPGAWDPYSIHALKVLRNVEAELAAMDVQVIAVTADSPVKIKELLDEHDIPFVVASDPALLVADRFGMIEKVHSSRLKQLQHAGVGEVKRLSTLNLLFFREDGKMESLWRPGEDDLLISQQQVKDMAAELHVLPSGP